MARVSYRRPWPIDSKRGRTERSVDAFSDSVARALSRIPDAAICIQEGVLVPSRTKRKLEHAPITLDPSNGVANQWPETTKVRTSGADHNLREAAQRIPDSRRSLRRKSFVRVLMSD